MERKEKEKTANILRKIARYTLLVVGILVFMFALLSGSAELGGGFMGIVKNSPNALPWLLLLLLIFIAWKWELLGGILITLLGLAAIYFVGFCGNRFFISTFILSLLITMLGSFFIFSWNLRREKKTPQTN